MIINYRSSSPNDFPFLKMLYRTTREHELNRTNWSEQQKKDFIEFQFNAQHSYYISSYKGLECKIIVFKKKDIGRLYIWKKQNRIRIVDISVLPSYRGKGIGTEILTSLIDDAIKNGQILELHVEHTNRAKRLYERLGFKVVDKERTHTRMEKLP